MSDDTDRLGYSAAEMAARFGRKTKTWTKWVREGKAPKPIRIGEAEYWPAEIIEPWMKRKIRER